jgi:hypothetical protein
MSEDSEQAQRQAAWNLGKHDIWYQSGDFNLSLMQMRPLESNQVSVSMIGT